MKLKFNVIGWKSKISQKRATYYISILKAVAMGCCLRKGQVLYCYTTEDNKGRPIMVAYLDGKERDYN